jgi:hypothetical protein
MIPILRDMKKLHLDIAERRSIFKHPEIVANMISNILSFPDPVKDLYMSALGL